MGRKANESRGFQIRRYGSYHSMPWRNGHGFTREIAREPAAGEEFAWRLSLADIECDGEFSAFPGYRRALVLVAGSRLRLLFRGRGDCLLVPTKRAARFEGDWQTYCEVPDGRCTDLSLIVRSGQATRPTAIVRAPRVVRVESSGRLLLDGGLHSALFILEGSVAITESGRARARVARAHDTLLLCPGRQRALRLHRLGRCAAKVILLRWRPGLSG